VERIAWPETFDRVLSPQSAPGGIEFGGDPGPSYPATQLYASRATIIRNLHNFPASLLNFSGQGDAQFFPKKSPTRSNAMRNQGLQALDWLIGTSFAIVSRLSIDSDGPSIGISRLTARDRRSYQVEG
jgi:hypothetical protein